MKIKMLKNSEGSNDGIYVSKYLEGQEYSVPQDITLRLATVFVEQMGVAEKVVVEIPKVKPVEKLETKVVEPKENKEKAKPKAKKPKKSTKKK